MPLAIDVALQAFHVGAQQREAAAVGVRAEAQLPRLEQRRRRHRRVAAQRARAPLFRVVRVEEARRQPCAPAEEPSAPRQL
eukprot:SAG11_NODE_615_length_8197_cov_4.551426_9_plen_81_part_00